MKNAFKKVFQLLKLLTVTPMAFLEAEKDCSTSKKIKTCLRNTMCENRLNALTMLSVESHMISKNIDFNKTN